MRTASPLLSLSQPLIWHYIITSPRHINYIRDIKLKFLARRQNCRSTIKYILPFCIFCIFLFLISISIISRSVDKERKYFRDPIQWCYQSTMCEEIRPSLFSSEWSYLIGCKISSMSRSFLLILWALAHPRVQMENINLFFIPHWNGKVISFSSGMASSHQTHTKQAIKEQGKLRELTTAVAWGSHHI